MKRIELDLNKAYDLYQQSGSLQKTVELLYEQQGIQIAVATLHSRFKAAELELGTVGRNKSDSALSNAEKQKRFRQRRKQQKQQQEDISL